MTIQPFINFFAGNAADIKHHLKLMFTIAQYVSVPLAKTSVPTSLMGFVKYLNMDKHLKTHLIRMDDLPQYLPDLNLYIVSPWVVHWGLEVIIIRQPEQVCY